MERSHPLSLIVAAALLAVLSGGCLAGESDTGSDSSDPGDPGACVPLAETLLRWAHEASAGEPAGQQAVRFDVPEGNDSTMWINGTNAGTHVQSTWDLSIRNPAEDIVFQSAMPVPYNGVASGSANWEDARIDSPIPGEYVLSWEWDGYIEVFSVEIEFAACT